MKKHYPKIIGCFLVLGIMTYCTFVSNQAHAKTFGELKQELINEQNTLKENENKEKLTQDQMNTVNQKIKTIQANIKKTYQDIDNLTVEIEQLKQDIEKKEEEIKKIINFAQISTGESTYLEYIFGASDYTDFIYRSAVAEQLADYNDQLIASFNQDIENNKKKQKELEGKRESLQVQQKDLEKQYDSLGDQLDEIVDVKMDVKDQIKYLEEMVQMYKDRGCQDDENIETCGDKVLPRNTKFYRPLVRGYATSEYGYRTGDFSGFHSGIDLSVSPNTNVNVYASGTGVVSGIVSKSKCGGNYVLIHHRMTNGDKYTTMYMHLAKVLVQVGELVTKDTVVGIMGGGHNSKTPSNYTPWDTCTTGPHNHFTIAHGLYGVDYKTWSAFMSHTFNPRNIVNFPSGRYNWFQNRLAAY